MRDMGADQKQAIVPDAGDKAAILSARVNRHVFADGAVAADLQAAGLAMIFPVLRDQADAGERKNLASGSDGCAPADHHMAVQPHALPQLNAVADDAVGTDRDALGQFCAPVDDRRRMHVHQCQASTIIAVTSASATFAPSTRASQANRQMFARRRTLRTWYSTVSPGTTGLRNFPLSMVMK
jgi:hypothetical protein